MTTNEKRNLDFDDLTLGDLMDFEEQTGKSLQDLQVEGAAGLDVKTMGVVVWLLRRHDEPELTLDEAIRTTRIGDLNLDVTAGSSDPQ